MITRSELVAHRSLCKDKALGSLIGLAVGDALGDLGRRDDYRKRYGIVTNLYEDAKSTDDTEFALLTARALLDCNGNLNGDAVVSAWQRYIIAHGGVFERGGMPQYGAVANLRRGVLPPFSGRDNVANYDDGAAMQTAQEAGRVIPRDLSIIGMDDIYPAAMTMPGLTTMAKQKYETGCQAARMLLERIEGKTPRAGRQCVLPCKLIERGSVAAPRV